MRILVVNDDGIDAPGIKVLANVASKFGETFVVAPKGQCSAMSQKVSIQTIIEVQKVNYEIPIKAAYSVTGTPADCVKIAFEHLNLKPDVVFSGINNGYNTGFDIAYSGTVGACFEALQKGVHSIAFSTNWGSDFDTVNAYIEDVARELINKKLPRN